MKSLLLLSVVICFFCAVQCQRYGGPYRNINNITSVQLNLPKLDGSTAVPSTVPIIAPTANEIVAVPKLVCPGKGVRLPFFSLPCKQSKDCNLFGKGLVCCTGRCLKGVPPPEPEIKHEPTWFGLVDRVCPRQPLAEFWDIKECKSDADCSPRICCPEVYPNRSTSIKYCRTAEPLLEKIPGPAKQFLEPIKQFMGYMQCTPPPPPLLDIFPKPCKNPIDCFPNLCCQELGKKVCRPPKKSVLTFIAGVGQSVVSRGLSLMRQRRKLSKG